jgi:hypothetical protein
MTADKSTGSAGGGKSGGGAPNPDASLDDLLKWAGQDTAKTAANPPAVRPAGTPPAKADDILSGRVVQRGRDEEGKEPARRRGFPPVWQIAVGAVVVWALVQFLASVLFMVGFAALAVAVVAGVYVIGKARGGRR